MQVVQEHRVKVIMVVLLGVTLTAQVVAVVVLEVLVVLVVLQHLAMEVAHLVLIPLGLVQHHQVSVVLMLVAVEQLLRVVLQLEQVVVVVQQQVVATVALALMQHLILVADQDLLHQKVPLNQDQADQAFALLDMYHKEI
jgi:hypothetical protein